MNKRIILTAAFFGLIAVILGAFGAHGLKGKISAKGLENWKTAVDYQFYHTFALLFLATFSRAKNNLINISYISFYYWNILILWISLFIIHKRNYRAFNRYSWTHYSFRRFVFYHRMD